MAAQKSSTCTQSSQGILCGYLGSPIVSAYDQTALTATGTITVPTNSNNGVGISRGLIRIQAGLGTVNAATVCAIGAITGTNGTNTVQLGATNRLAATAAGTVWDLLADFVCAILVTSISFTVTLSGGTTIATINTEVFGTP